MSSLVYFRLFFVFLVSTAVGGGLLVSASHGALQPEPTVVLDVPLAKPEGGVVNVTSLVLYDPIIINGDDELTTATTQYGWLGNGSASDPVKIENLSIMANSSYPALTIANTTNSILINNSVIGSSSAGTGIFLSNVTHLILSDSTIENLSTGIEVIGSTQLNFTNLLVRNISSHGIRMNSTSVVRIEDCIISNATTGLGVSHSQELRLSDNTFTNQTQHSITLNNSTSVIQFNSFQNSSYGVFIHNGPSIPLEYNTVLFGNNFSNHGWYAVQSFGPVTAFNNNFLNNSYLNTTVIAGNHQVCLPSAYLWGNYWSDNPGGDTDLDGFKDSPYLLYLNHSHNRTLNWARSAPTAPMSRSPSQLYSFGYTNTSLEVELPFIGWWTSNETTHNYLVYENGSLVGNYTFSFARPVLLSLESVISGLYEFQLNIGGWEATTNVEAVRRDGLTPQITTLASELTFFEGTPNQLILWSIQDNNIANYTIFVFGSAVKNGTVPPSGDVVYPVSYLTNGTYFVQLRVSDKSGYSSSSTVTVVVYPQPTTTASTNLTDITSSTDINREDNPFDALVIDLSDIGYEYWLGLVLLATVVGFLFVRLVRSAGKGDAKENFEVFQLQVEEYLNDKTSELNYRFGIISGSVNKEQENGVSQMPSKVTSELRQYKKLLDSREEDFGQFIGSQEASFRARVSDKVEQWEKYLERRRAEVDQLEARVKRYDKLKPLHQRLKSYVTKMDNPTQLAERIQADLLDLSTEELEHSLEIMPEPPIQNVLMALLRKSNGASGRLPTTIAKSPTSQPKRLTVADKEWRRKEYQKLKTNLLTNLQADAKEVRRSFRELRSELRGLLDFGAYREARKKLVKTQQQNERAIQANAQTLSRLVDDRAKELGLTDEDYLELTGLVDSNAQKLLNDLTTLKDEYELKVYFHWAKTLAEGGFLPLKEFQEDTEMDSFNFQIMVTKLAEAYNEISISGDNLLFSTP